MHTVHQHLISCLYYSLYLLTEMTFRDPRSLTQSGQAHPNGNVPNKWPKKATVRSFTVHKINFYELLYGMQFHETCINSGKGLLLFEIEILGMDKNTNWLANVHSINYISFGHPYFALMKSMMVPVNTTCIPRCDWLDGHVGVFTKYPSIDSRNICHEAGTKKTHINKIFSC